MANSQRVELLEVVKGVGLDLFDLVEPQVPEIKQSAQFSSHLLSFRCLLCYLSPKVYPPNYIHKPPAIFAHTTEGKAEGINCLSSCIRANRELVALVRAFSSCASYGSDAF